MLTDKLLLNNDQFFTEVARMLAGGNSVTLRAKGNSMYPFIVDGRDSVILQTYRKTAAVGDIVLAHLPEKGFVLHRIYKNDGNEFVLMGDGNLHTTERCSKNDIVLNFAMNFSDNVFVGLNVGFPYARYGYDEAFEQFLNSRQMAV